MYNLCAQGQLEHEVTIALYCHDVYYLWEQTVQ